MIALMVAGLGLFFIGVKLIGESLRGGTGRRFRRAVAAATRRPVVSAALGALSGALTQSTSAVTFIVVNLTAARLTTVERAVPMLVWANVGTSALVMLATLEVDLFVMFLIGAVGVGYFADLHRSADWGRALATLMGLGLLFLGLQMIKDGAGPLREVEIVREFVAFSAGDFLIAFLSGLLLTLVAQSSATVSVIAVSLVSVGLLSVDQTVMLIYGAGVGSGLSVWFLGAGERGVPRQMVNLQLCVKLAGAVILVPLFLIERAAGEPLVGALVARVASAPAERAALFYLVYQLVAAVAVTAVSRPLLAFIRELSPETEDETLAHPRHIVDADWAEPDRALELARLEQTRLVGFIAESLDNIRQDKAGEAVVDYETLARAGAVLGEEIDGFLEAGLDVAPTRGADARIRMEALIGARGAGTLLADLSETVRSLVGLIDRARIPPELSGITHGVVEGLHAATLTLGEEFADPAESGVGPLLTMTADRSAMMERVRREFLVGAASLDQEAQETLYGVTHLFERALWLIHRLALGLTVTGIGHPEGRRPGDAAA